MWAIAEVCHRTGLSPRTIRYYEEIGLLPGVRRRESGRRVYGGDDLERLGFINRLKSLGLSLAEIRDLNAVYGIGGSTQAMLSRLQDLLGAHLDDVDRRMGELSDLRDELVRYRDHVEDRAGSALGPDAKPVQDRREAQLAVASITPAEPTTSSLSTEKENQ
ncbi:MAG TPA: MerR family transcriptional regulator [Myxococcales bacterium]|jgi:DNA-binding transcriptional MerR regulator|nr:MerR family transcriptional regulator [Myxococcales bacterium]HIL80249.1 MerR family transcriptional regulator [Myxococcales bacterium]